KRKYYLQYVFHYTAYDVNEGDLVAPASLQSADQPQHRARRCLASIEENGRGADQDLDVSVARRRGPVRAIPMAGQANSRLRRRRNVGAGTRDRGIAGGDTDSAFRCRARRRLPRTVYGS